MATFTLTVTATLINVTAGNGTLAQLQADTNAVSAGSFTASGQTYTVNGTRELRTNSGVVVTTTDGDRLEWALAAHDYPNFYVNTGSTWNITQNTTISGDTTTPASHYCYFYLYGTVHCNGTNGNPVIWENMRSIYCPMFDTTPWVWTYVTIRECSYSTGYMLYFYGNSTSGWDATQVAHSFTNITISDSRGYGIFYFVYGDYSKWILEDWTIDGIEEGNINYNHAAKFVRWTIKNTDDYIRHYNNGGALTTSRLHTSKTEDFAANGYNQSMIVFEDCEFDNVDSGSYNFLTYGGGEYLLKDCTTKNASRGFYAFDAIIRLYGTQTYTNITTERTWSGSGTFLHSRKLDITVQDADAAAIENATVRIRTKLVKTVSGRDYPYEEYSFLTDENGQVKGMVEDSIYLTEKEETSLNNFTQWSDGNGNNVHIIEVSKTGYTLDTREVAMTQDRDITVTLTANDDTTKIIDSTIYDSVIY